MKKKYVAIFFLSICFFLPCGQIIYSSLAFPNAGPPSAPERLRRVAVEAVISSPRFQVRAVPDVLLARRASVMDWHSGKGLLALGSSDGKFHVGFGTGPILGGEPGMPFRAERARGAPGWEFVEVMRGRSKVGGTCAEFTGCGEGVGNISSKLDFY